MTHEHMENFKDSLRFVVIWLGTFVSNINNWVLFATLIYTGLQIYVLVRDKILKKGKE